MKIRTSPEVCSKRPEADSQIVDGHTMCFKNIFKLKFEMQKVDDKLVNIIIEDMRSDRVEILTTVPDQECPFYLEQLVNHKVDKKNG